MRQDPAELSDLLCPEEDNNHQPLRRVQKRRRVAKPKTRAAPKKGIKYLAKHKDIWAGLEPEAPPAIFNDVNEFPTPRELDVAVYDYIQREDEYEVGVERFLDVSQSIDRCPRQNSFMPTVTPGATMVMVRREEPQ